jgi:hypothetical protein
LVTALACAGPGIRHRAAITNRKLTASRKNACPMPHAFTIRPAGAGPSMPLRCAVEAKTELAAGNCCGSTSVGISDEPAGNEKASATPNSSESA